MNEDQEADHDCKEKLIRLLVRRHDLSPDSDQLPTLAIEINAVESLVPYRLVAVGERDA